MGVSIFYRRCPATSLYLASYPATPSGAEATALVPMTGTCVPHSKAPGGTAPRMHCNAEGEWMVPVGGCVCDEGYEQNVNGSACLGESEDEPIMSVCVEKWFDLKQIVQIDNGLPLYPEYSFIFTFL